MPIKPTEKTNKPEMSRDDKAELVREYRLKCINAYKKAKIPLFPVETDKDRKKKKPMFKGWKETKFNPKLDPISLGDSFGVPIPNTMVFFDVDPRREAEGEDQLRALFDKLKLEIPFDRTFVVRTASSGKRGWHIYFSKPADFPVINTFLPEFPAIEVKTYGRYVVAAGSVHANSGRQYLIHKEGHQIPNKLMECPPALLEYIRDDHVFEASGGDDIIVEDEVTIKRVCKMLKKAEPAYEGAGGNDTTYKTACRVKDEGLSPEKALELMLEHYNPRCAPEWEERELSDIVKHAYAHGRNRIGVRSAEADFEDFDPKEYLAEYEKRHPEAKKQQKQQTKEPESEAQTTSRIPKFKQWDWNKDGTKKSTFNNLINHFLPPTVEVHAVNPLYRLMRFNSFAYRIEFLKLPPWMKPSAEIPEEWTDRHTGRLRHWIGQHKAFDASKTLFNEAVEVVADFEAYHPVKDYFDSLEWDGVARLDSMLHTYLGVEDNPYTREVSKNMVMAAVARVETPGIQHDYMPVIEGVQGLGKSTFVKILGGDWYADFNIEPHNKDTFMCMQGSLIIEASEMGFMRQTDVQALKAFISRTSDKYRPAYGHFAIMVPRQCTFVGTMNPDPNGNGYFRDNTGNRRFWPVVATKKLSRKALRKDRDQLFAEAVVRFRKGEPFHIIDPEIEKIAAQEQGKRIMVDAWDSIIAEWLSGREEAEANGNSELQPLTVHLIGEAALNLPRGKIGRIEMTRICDALRKYGYVPGNRASDAKRSRTWKPKPETEESEV